MGHRVFVRFGPFEYSDVLDEDQMVGILCTYRIEAVVHCEAKVLGSEAVHIPERYLSANVGGTAVLLAAMKAMGVVKLVFSSSAVVYGEGATWHQQAPRY